MRGPLIVALLLLLASAGPFAQTPPGPPAGGPPAATTSPMGPPRLPPFAGEVVNFDRRGEKVVACVNAAAAPPPGKPGGPVPPKPAAGTVPPRYRIWIIEREVMQELLTTAGLCDPRWSPDGTRFAAAGLRGVFTFSEPNYEPRVLVAGQAQAPAPGDPPAREYDDPVWSPNGAAIAFRVGGAGGARVDVVNVTSAEVLLRREGAAKTLQWSGDRTIVVDGTRVPLP